MLGAEDGGGWRIYGYPASPAPPPSPAPSVDFSRGGRKRLSASDLRLGERNEELGLMPRPHSFSY